MKYFLNYSLEPLADIISWTCFARLAKSRSLYISASWSAAVIYITEMCLQRESNLSPDPTPPPRQCPVCSCPLGSIILPVAQFSHISGVSEAWRSLCLDEGAEGGKSAWAVSEMTNMWPLGVCRTLIIMITQKNQRFVCRMHPICFLQLLAQKPTWDTER